MAENGTPVTSRDPAVYDEYKKRWSAGVGLDGEDAWLQRAEEVAHVLATDVAQRDKENKSPRAEISLLKHSGLLKLLGPKKYGGGGQPWSVGYKAIRKVAEADGYGELLYTFLYHAYKVIGLLGCFWVTTSYGQLLQMWLAPQSKPTDIKN